MTARRNGFPPKNMPIAFLRRFCRDLRAGGALLRLFRRRNRPGGERGSFLLEPAIILAIMIAVAGLATPATGFLRDRLAFIELDAEARRLIAELRYMEEMAATYRRVDSAFTAADHETIPKLYLTATGYRLSQSNKVIRRRELPKGMLLTNNESRSELVFSAGEALTATIGLTKNGRCRYVIIDREGRVRLADCPPGS